MPVTQDIAAMYRRPRAVMRRLLGAGENEGRALAVLLAGCAVVFISNWPRLARQAHLTGEELNPLLGGSLMAWMLIMPLALYTLSFVIYLGLRAVTPRADSFTTRFALFWALLASSPLLLLNGLVAGFIGAGIELSLVGLAWLVAFLWFFMSGIGESLKLNGGEDAG